MGITLSQAGPGGIPFQAGDDAETEMLDGDSSITTPRVTDCYKVLEQPAGIRPTLY